MCRIPAFFPKDPVVGHSYHPSSLLLFLTVDKERTRFREVIHTMQAAPLENVMGLISSNVPFFLGTNTSIFMQEMLDELDAMEPRTVVALGNGYQVTVEQQRAALVNLFTLTMDFIEGFVSHTQGELRSHQSVLKEILEAAQNGTDIYLVDALLFVSLRVTLFSTKSRLLLSLFHPYFSPTTSKKQSLRKL